MASLYQQFPQDDESWPLPYASKASSFGGQPENEASEDDAWPLPANHSSNAPQDFARVMSSDSNTDSSTDSDDRRSTSESSRPSIKYAKTVEFQASGPITAFSHGKETTDSEIMSKELAPMIEKIGDTGTEKMVKKRPSAWMRFSLLIDDWTPTLLVVLYFIISISAYMVLPENIVTIAWYTYLTLAFFVSAAVTAEACASNRPARDARRARKRLAETGEEDCGLNKCPN